MTTTTNYTEDNSATDNCTCIRTVCTYAERLQNVRSPHSYTHTTKSNVLMCKSVGAWVCVYVLAYTWLGFYFTSKLNCSHYVYSAERERERARLHCRCNFNLNSHIYIVLYDVDKYKKCSMERERESHMRKFDATTHIHMHRHTMHCIESWTSCTHCVRLYVHTSSIHVLIKWLCSALRYIAHFPYCDSVVNALFEHNHMQNRTNQIWDPNRMDNDLRKWHENKICPDMEIIEQIKHQRFGRQKEKIAKAMQFARYW